MSDETAVTIEMKKLDKLIKALGEKMPTIKIGILGSGARAGGGLTNAEVGAAHEFGTSKLPVRSFLRGPLSEELGPALEENQILSKKTFKAIMDSGSVEPLFATIAIIAEGVVLGAFSSGGYGKWKTSDMTHKKIHQTLVETTQLRDSITSEVVSS